MDDTASHGPGICLGSTSHGHAPTEATVQSNKAQMAPNRRTHGVGGGEEGVGCKLSPLPPLSKMRTPEMAELTRQCIFISTWCLHIIYISTVYFNESMHDAQLASFHKILMSAQKLRVVVKYNVDGV